MQKEITVYKSGVGGSRTLVQTRSPMAFYVRIRLLVFDRYMEIGILYSGLYCKISGGCPVKLTSYLPFGWYSMSKEAESGLPKTEYSFPE